MLGGFFKSFKAQIQDFWLELVGSPAQFSLEQRIYNTFCLITLLAVTYNIPFNYAVGLYWSSFLSLFMVVVLSFAYYLSRFRNRHQVSFTVAAITVQVVFGVNYFFNAGINGPTLLLLALSYFPIIAVAPMRQGWAWSMLNLTLLAGLLCWEYFFPASISGHYATRERQFIDVASSYIMVFILVRVCTVSLVKSYNAARVASEQAAADLLVLNQEKNKLFSIISHDLRAPLANIQGYLQFLFQMDLPQDTRREVQAQLLRNTQNTLEMLTNLLSWSKNQMEGVSIAVSPLPLSSLLPPTVDLFRDIALGKGISLHSSLAPHLVVMADTDMVQLVVRNLINNAIKFTLPGGTVQVTATEENGSCLLRVTDSGNGKPLQLSPDVFKLSGKITYGTSREKGVGLGLVLCREFVEAQQGKIWFELHPSSGVTFVVQLPLAAKALSVAEPSRPAAKI
ncbi:sensor histidine kinase [Rufibacter quisquiliarum]|uniref:histidine kinase n=1 Tax=Rufibacter quisquiliarum TaxID=1549639 RepID=A0A839GTR1_9BACT|nr:HAMP domain-containing sensor histidine kinase [Rufibacter quisquiliarum]MBA9077788.1 signal transduction histidine kinase [Rufibacter quisquiliarum]